eukprot:g41786.t1
MASTDLDFSFSPRSFVNVEQMGNYIQDYARAFSVLPIVRSRANVTRVLRAPKQSVTAQASNGFGSGMERNGWQVTWKDISKNSEGKQHMETFDAVVVANGHYNVEYWADIAGATEWLAQGKGRKIVHAKSYKQPQQFLDKTVLIVGARPSGQDIARELIGVARWIYVMDKSCKQSVTEGTCTHVPISSRVTIDGLLLHESVTLPGLPIDTIILATGYLYDFPFLSASELGMADFRQRFVAPLYQHVLHTSIPSLAFIGLPSSIPAPMLMFEAQARFVASEWSKQKLSSSEAVRVQWVQERFKQAGTRKQDVMSGTAGISSWQYIKQLTALSGLNGDPWDRFCKRLSVVEEIYEARASHRPRLPWHDDWYRRCEYSVDWDTGKWTVQLPKDAGK